MTPEKIALLTEVVRWGEILIATVVIAGALVAIIGLWRAPETILKVSLAIIGSDGATQTIVTIIVIASTVVLRLLDKISPEATVAMLSLVVGYVLGGIRKKRRTVTEVPPQSN